jgi:hypothetical protein
MRLRPTGLVADFPSVGALRAKLGVDMADPKENRITSVPLQGLKGVMERMITLMYSVFEYH